DGPEADGRIIAAAGQRLPVRREGQRGDAVAVPDQSPAQRASRRLPYPHLSGAPETFETKAGARQQGAVRRERERTYGVSTVDEFRLLPSAGHVPHGDTSVGAPSGQEPRAVRARGRRKGNRLGVPIDREGVTRRSGPRVPQLDFVDTGAHQVPV